MIKTSPTEDDTANLAAAVYAALAGELGGLTILLNGELGAGKSTFARAFIRASGHKGAVPSPTYTLVEPYEVASGAIYHVDLYRISSEDELQFLGWEDLEHGCRLIEWPERVPSLKAQADLNITLHYDGAGRRLEFEALSARGQSLIEKIN